MRCEVAAAAADELRCNMQSLAAANRVYIFAAQMQGTQLTASSVPRSISPLRVTLRRWSQTWSVLFGCFELLINRHHVIGCRAAERPGQRGDRPVPAKAGGRHGA